MEQFVIILVGVGAAGFLIRQLIKSAQEGSCGSCSQNCSCCEYANKSKPVENSQTGKGTGAAEPGRDT